MSGSKSQGQQSSGPTPEQRRTQAFALENILTPLASTLVPQIVEALETGGAPGAQLPLVQRSTEAARTAAARANRATQDRVAVQGLAGTPFGENVVAGQTLQGEQNIANVPVNVAQQFASLASPLVTGGGAISIGGPGVSEGSSKSIGKG